MGEYLSWRTIDFMSSHLRITRCIIGAYASFLGMAATCSLLYPQVFDHYAYGISTFGSVGRTAPFFILGFLGTIICMAVIAKELCKFERALPLRIALWAGIVFMAGILVTSVGAYSQWHSTYLVHVIFASMLAISQTFITLWAVQQKGATVLDYGLALGFIAIVIISILPLVGDIPGFRSYPLREALAFVCAMGLMGRASLRAVDAGKSTPVTPGDTHIGHKANLAK
jgi:hypothetical protein